MPSRPIASIDSLRRRIPTIVRAVNANPSLALRASANPLLALEELGYELTDDLRREADHFVRFGPEDAATLNRLAAEMDRISGERIDLQSATAVTRTLSRLGVRVEVPADRGDVLMPEAALSAQEARPTGARKPAQARKVQPISAASQAALRTARDDSRRLVPVLAELKGRKPIVEPLVAYLQLEATRPRLAPREVYEALRDRKPDPNRPQISVRFVLRRAPDQG